MKNKNYVLSAGLVLVLALAFSQSVSAGFVKSSEIAFENYAVLNDAAQAKRMGNDVIDKLVAKDFEGITRNFDDNLKQNLSAKQIGEVWSQVLAAAGEYKSREESQTQERDGNFGAFTVCQMTKGKIRVDVWVNGNGKIMGLWVNPA